MSIHKPFNNLNDLIKLKPQLLHCYCLGCLSRMRLRSDWNPQPKVRHAHSVIATKPSWVSPLFFFCMFGKRTDGSGDTEKYLHKYKIHNPYIPHSKAQAD